MRIAMLTNNYKPFIGGVPISIERLAEGLRKLGHEVYIFAPSYESAEEEEYVIRYKTMKRKMEGGMIMPNIFDSRIEKQFRELQFDIIHVHHPMLIGYTAIYLSKKYDIPVVFTYHTRYEQYLHYLRPFGALGRRCGVERNRLLRKFEEAMLSCSREKVVPMHNRLFTNACDMVFAPTPMMKDYLIEHGTKTPITVLPTGLKAECFQTENGSGARCDNGTVLHPEREGVQYDGRGSRAAEIRNEFLSGRKFLLCTVSRLEKEKNLTFLLKGIERLKEKIGDCFRLLVIGDGSERDALADFAWEHNLEENVVFTGCIPQEEIMDYYRACDMFVFASKSETQGIVLLEAMAAKLPVAAVTASGVIDVVKNGMNGYMTDETEEEFSDAMVRILQNEELRENLKKGAFEEALCYRDTSVAGMAERCYEAVCFNRRIRRTAVAYKVG